jgi:hypothetical protein
MEVASIIISVVALVVSVIVAWHNYLSPFHLELHCGSPRLEPQPLKLEGGKKVARFAVVLPMHFANTGALGGVVTDIVLKVRTPEGSTWLFLPFFYTRYGVSNESTFGKKFTEDSTNEPFHPLHLLGREKTYRAVAFVALPNDNFPLGVNPLSSGTYTFQIETLETGKDDYALKSTFAISLSEKNVKEWGTSDSPSYLVPFLEETKQKRGRLTA